MTNLIQRWKEHLKAKRKKELKERAEELYQMKEHEGEMWITFNYELIMPTRFVNGDPIHVLRQIRAAYIERKEDEL